MDYNNMMISTYIIGELGTEFDCCPEFDLHYVMAQDRWKNFYNIVGQACRQGEDDAVVICYEGHHFTKDYLPAVLFDKIIRSAKLGTHILIGGCSSFSNLVPVEEGLFWVDNFEGANFYVVFKHAFQSILEVSPAIDESLERVLSHLLPNKLLLSPFISWVGVEGHSDKQLKLYNHVINKYQMIAS